MFLSMKDKSCRGSNPKKGRAERVAVYWTRLSSGITRRDSTVQLKSIEFEKCMYVREAEVAILSAVMKVCNGDNRKPFEQPKNRVLRKSITITK